MSDNEPIRGRIYLIGGNAKQMRRANKLFRDYQIEASQSAFLRRYSLQVIGFLLFL